MKFDQNCWCWDDENKDVGDTQVNQEYVGRVPEVFGLEYNVRHECIPWNSNQE